MVREVELIYWDGKYYDLTCGEFRSEPLYTINDIGVYCAESLLDDIGFYPNNEIVLKKERMLLEW